MKLYNTLTRHIDEIKPHTPGQVKLYTCGLTVYNQPHIGNWIGYIYWDILVRTLKSESLKVERTQNITDVGHLVSDDDAGEDKLEVGAKREGLSAWDVAQKYIQIADTEAYELLGLIPPTHTVRATDCIAEQISFAEELEKKGFTYIIPQEGLYFDTSKLSDYGKLARLDIKGLQAGARVAINGKKNPTDFAIWKFSPEDVKRDMEWDSPWGIGFPGWHLECSVIARITLGDQIDIHTGGIDHIPVHHTNEIAQTEAVTGHAFAHYWLHNNHLKIDGGKMSKSVGNVYTLQDILERGYDIEAFKLFVMSKHYRTEGNFTWDILDAAQNRLKHWLQIAALRHQSLIDGSNTSEAAKIKADFYEAMQQCLGSDLDTPSALMTVENVLTGFEQNGSNVDSDSLAKILEVIEELLGITLAAKTPDIDTEQKKIIKEREQAREHKDWQKSDELRSYLANQGIGINDTPDGSIWHWL